MDERFVLTILGMSLLTYIPRFLPMLLLSRTELPQAVLTWLGFLPSAILSALVAQQVFISDDRLDVSFSNPNLIPAILTGIIAWRTRSLGWTVVGGIVVAALYRTLI